MALCCARRWKRPDEAEIWEGIASGMSSSCFSWLMAMAHSLSFMVLIFGFTISHKRSAICDSARVWTLS
jgi:hypothetical protein